MKIIKTSLALSVFALLLASCSETRKQDNASNSKDTMVLKKDDAAASPTPKADDAWARVDWNAPVQKYGEVKSGDVSVRGNDQYGIYGLGENVLFETGKADIKANAQPNLDQVAESIKAHYDGGKVKVYGFTDAKGSADANAALSRQRAEAVKNYLVNNCKIGADRITMYAEGESHPVASNGDPKGREMNRRVEVVAMKP